jgi:hypothetical protein
MTEDEIAEIESELKAMKDELRLLEICTMYAKDYESAIKLRKSIAHFVYGAVAEANEWDEEYWQCFKRRIF